ncbi:MAG TPA: hypothetical protein VGB54_03850 [Allosphingosinicella sp.]|jgi:ElaB/YqjD/DUF883 family membrane-anchored ribosome-binding protein
MPPRDPSLPEGTDHIIDTNIDLGDPGNGGGGGSGGGTGSSGSTGSTGGGTGSAGGSGSGATGGSAFQFDKESSGGSGSSGKGGIGKAADTIATQVREQISTLTSQAGDRARTMADDGKRHTTSFLQAVAQVVSEATGSVEDRLGPQYTGLGHRASDSINSLASSLDARSVDDLYDDARAFVRRSPAVAMGIAAIVGFAIARVVRSSVAEMSSGDKEGGNGATGTGTGATRGKATGGSTTGTGTTGTGTTGNAAMGSAGTSSAGAA